MCYDVQTHLEAQLKRARRLNDAKAIAEISKKIKPYVKNFYHAPGFAHPNLLVYKNNSPNEPQAATWGLVPHWVKTAADKLNLWNNTLNAKSETLFEKPAYRESAANKRCLVPVSAFFEHHHKNGQNYPYRIFRKDGAPMMLAGIWSEWVDEDSGELLESFSVVTTTGNNTLSKIHNNPKLSGPRMPVILQEKDEDLWLDFKNSTKDSKHLERLFRPFSDKELDSFPVEKLRGKNAVGNSEVLTQKKHYPELEHTQGSLF